MISLAYYRHLIGKGGLTIPTEKITDGIAFWEALEGMRVTLDAPLAKETLPGMDL